MNRFLAKSTPAKAAPPPSSDIPSSSPAFGTPAHTLKPFVVTPAKHTILPIILPPPTLRPLAFRTFTKKHSLTLTSSALQELASFIGRHCGSGWREDGLAEKVLEEVAKSWKLRNGGVIIDGTSSELKDILKILEGNMSGGRLMTGAHGLSRQNSLMEQAQEVDITNTRLGIRPVASLTRADSSASLGLNGSNGDDELDDESLNDVRRWLKVVNALDQPRLKYNVTKKHFERDTSKPSILASAAHKTAAFRNRYNIIHQRLLRNESFQESAVSSARASNRKSLANSQGHKITPIAHLLGRHGTHHMLLGLLIILPTGGLAISDLTGTISLDLSQTMSIPHDSAFFCPGMIVLVDGTYEEEDEFLGRGLSGNSGVGGLLGGKFQAFFIGQPPCEKRKTTLGVSGPDGGQDHAVGGGFGWIDFLGVGSERASGQKMRKLENRLLRQLTSTESSRRARMVVLGELNLDNPRTLPAVRHILSIYATEQESALPMTFVLAGNFTQHPIMARGGSGGSVEYKEYFDELAATLGEFPSLLQNSTFVFVPGDNDGWVSSFSAGAATPLPRKGVPEMFTSRIRRMFATTNAGDSNPTGPEAIWTTNPSRLSVFGPGHEIVLFRDDMLARLRRTSVRLRASEAKASEEGRNSQESGQMETDEVQAIGSEANDTANTQTTDIMDIDATSQLPSADASAVPTISTTIQTARKLVKTILDQGYLSPFRPQIRPVHWDYAGALQLYPLPTSMVLVDATAEPFCVTYEGCHVINPGSLLVPGRKAMARWVEYEIGGLGKLRDCTV